MYIVPIAWAYVVVIMAAGDSSVFNGIMTLFLWGVLPISIFVYIFGTPKRRRQRAQAEHQAALFKQQQDLEPTPTDLTRSGLPADHPPYADGDNSGDRKST